MGKIVVTARRFDGGAEGDRTLDLRIANATLSQLSYRPTRVQTPDGSGRRGILKTGRWPGQANRDSLLLAPCLTPATKAPEFTLPDQDGHDISLTALLKDGPAILYFYPADFTPGCTREACSIRDIHRELTRAGLTVAGISPQSPESHKRFREKHGLPFTLLSDETKEVIKMFGVNGPLGFWVQRVTFLVDQNRVDHRDA